MAAGNFHDGISGRQGVPHALKWTEERVQQLKKLWSEGLSCSKIADEMAGGLTKNGVIGKVMRLGLPPRRGANDSHRAMKGARSHKPTAPKPSPKQLVSKTVMTPVQVKTKTGTSFHRMVEKVVTAQEMPNIDSIVAPNPELQVSIMEARGDHCRWPIGDPADIWTFRYCGGDASGDRSYCGFHAKLAYQPPATRQLSEETKEKIRLAALRRRQSGQSWVGV